MDGLRWLLLLFGALVIAGVYLYSRRERDKPPQEQVPAPRRSPILGEDSSESDEPGADGAAAETESGAESESSEQSPQKIVTLRLVARNKGAFRGDDLILSLRGIGMRSGKFGIYHRCDGNDESRIIFSAASLVEPGSFDLENIKEQEIPGISLFIILPGPIDGAEGFDMMMAAARTLAQSLDAELLDESGSTLSVQRERYMREEIIQFQHSNLVA
jgi:cell division protein ZipA